jgi:hypothetical protein
LKQFLSRKQASKSAKINLCFFMNFTFYSCCRVAVCCNLLLPHLKLFIIINLKFLSNTTLLQFCCYVLLYFIIVIEFLRKKILYCFTFVSLFILCQRTRAILIYGIFSKNARGKYSDILKYFLFSEVR